MASSSSSSSVPTDPVLWQRPRRARRATAAVVAALMATVGLWSTGHSTPAQAADTSGAQAAVTWLADQLQDGTFANPLSAGPDHGLMIDAVFAMAGAGRADLAEPIIEVLDDQGGALRYASYVSFLPGQDQDRVSGAVAKLLVAALVAGADVHDFGGMDLVADTRASITTDGPEAGRISDRGPNISSNNSNTFGQILAVIGLAGAGARFDDALVALLRQQCASGYFRIFFTPAAAGSPTTCDQAASSGGSPPDGDTTGFGLQALVAARAAGAAGLDGPISAAAHWLITHQDTSGGWGGGVSTAAPNTNSTGLIVQALAGAGLGADAVERGVAYLQAAQARGDDASTALAADMGAIAYTPGAHDAARTDGIGSRDTWIRATAQASLGLSQVDFWGLVNHQAPEPPSTTGPPVTSGAPGPSTSTPGPTSTAPSTAPSTTPGGPGASAPSPTVGAPGGPAHPATTVPVALIPLPTDGRPGPIVATPAMGWQPGPNAQSGAIFDPAFESSRHAPLDGSTSQSARAGDDGRPGPAPATNSPSSKSSGSSETAQMAKRAGASASNAAGAPNPAAADQSPASGGPAPIVWALGGLGAVAVGVGAFKLAGRPRRTP